MHKFHHFFCGYTCALKFRIDQLFSDFLTLPGKVHQELSRPVKLAYVLIPALLIPITIAAGIQFVDHADTEYASFGESITKVEEPNSVLASNSGYVDPISVIEKNISRRGLTVSGIGLRHEIFAVQVNGSLHVSTIARKGQFKLQDIPLKTGNNIVTIHRITPGHNVYWQKTFAVNYTYPDRTYLSSNISRGDTKMPKISLTFDGDALNNNAEEILDILERHGIRSTFFLTGGYIKKFPATVKRIVKNGHEVGNHTFSHPHLTTFEENNRHDTHPELTEQRFKAELLKTDSLFKDITGGPMAWYWRAPYGEQNEELRKWAADLGYKHIRWTTDISTGQTLDTRDWVSDTTSYRYNTANEIKNNLLNYGAESSDEANGGIILMHLGTLREKEFAYQKLPEIIEGFTKKGYTLTTIGEMLRKNLDKPD